MPPDVAVLIPCKNEELTIAEVVNDFRTALPTCRVYVYDNNSTDNTVARAREAGAIVRNEQLQGKGNVVRRMFSDVGADVYLMADGDGTYDPKIAPALVRMITDESLDMVVGVRLSDESEEAFRLGHRAGNKTLTKFVGWLFGHRFSDILSGYRAFSRRFVKSFPALASGFEIETELTIHALELKMPVGEIGATYAARPKGSHSKLSTWRHGFRIFATIIFLFKEVRPARFFGAIFAILALISLGLTYPLVVTYFQTGLVPRLPTVVMTTGIMLLAFLSGACGIILDTVSRGRRESKRMIYLSMPGPGES
ncbi:MAG: glycosyltransferase [Proteobacteria bacterium]|nr:glycosyltransferase [Pseudomonadota bacterium]